MSDKTLTIPEMEVFRTEEFYVLMKSESSLWFNRKTGEISARPGWELANCGDVECLGVFYGLIGKVELQVDAEARLLLIKDAHLVGELPDGRAVFKIKSVVLLHPCSGQQPAQNLGLHTCKKHRASGYSMFHLPQKAALAKTWGSIKSATNSIKSTTQQAAALATYQVKGGSGSKKETRDRERFEKRILDELSRMFTETDSFYFCLERAKCEEEGEESEEADLEGGGRGPTSSPSPPLITSDLTNCLQRHSTKESTGADDRFFWNKYMLNDIYLLNNELANAWILPIIQGYVQIENCHIDVDPTAFQTKESQKLRLAIVSRRSRYRAGTRYKRRGIDEKGDCANYVETEQVISSGFHALSFVQVRGSAPLFWSQPGYKYRPPPRIDKGEGETKAAFEKHMEGELKRYGPVCIVNLIEQTGKERVIWEAFTQQIIQFDSEQVSYAPFDFHEHCRGMKFENVSLLITKIEEMVQEMGFCWKDKDGIICRQSGVFRVNCVDCLDRTNVVQTALGKSVVEMQLTKLGLVPPEGHLPPSFSRVFHQLWANNGDVISKQYAGTNALKGDYTRTGERKFTGLMKDGMNSANRYYLSRFKDVYRQATIDIMQGVPVGGIIDEGVEVEETDSMATAEHVKLLIEDCKKLLVPECAVVLGAWGLINAHPMTGDHNETDMDTILVLTKDSYYIADYDDEVDKVVKVEKVLLSEIVAVELGQVELTHSSFQIFNKGKNKGTVDCCLRVRYVQDEIYHEHVLRSSYIRFFNNVAIIIMAEDEMIESLRAIGDAFKIALEVNYTGREMNVHFDFEADKMLTWGESLPVASQQLQDIKSAGNKALSSMSSKFTKLGNSLNRSSMATASAPPEFAREAQTAPADTSHYFPTSPVPEFCISGAERGDGNLAKCESSFLPGVGIVMSNREIGYLGSLVDPSDVIITTDSLTNLSPSRCHNSASPQLRVRTFSHSSGEVDDREKGKDKDKEMLEVAADGAESGERRGMALELAQHGITTSQSDNALRYVKSGLSQLSSPSAVLSPLTRLAKGVLAGGAGGRRNASHADDLNEAWLAARCKTRLIIV